MRIGTLISVILGVAGTFVIAAAQTSVTEAKSNLSGWLNELGLTELPSFLTSINADSWGTAFGILLIAVALALYLFRRSQRLKEPRAPSYSKATEPEAYPTTEHRLIPKGITIDGRRHADGIDLWIFLHIRNRSSLEITMRNFEWHYEIAGNSPLTNYDVDYNPVMPSSSEQVIRLSTVRIYSAISPDETGWLKSNITFVSDGINSTDKHNVSVYSAKDT